MRTHEHVKIGVLVVLVACSHDSSDVVGPFTGPVHRYAVDAITIPRESGVAQAMADDLDGDGKVDNQLGAVTSVLASTMDLSVNAPDMIAAGALASAIEIQADDLLDDDTVGVRYLGTDGDAATAVGGRFVGGVFRSNRSRDTNAPGTATIRIPIFTNADPVTLELDGVEIDLDPDGGGFVATVRGGIPKAGAADAAYAGLLQMIADEPDRHLLFARLLDANLDGVLDRDEFDNSVITLLIAPDLQLFDGARYAPHPGSTMRDSVSVAFQVHLSPCDTGTCASGVPADRCRDRVRDGDETDVDCGGGCQPCQAAASCVVPGDCQTHAC
ncbi:MAG TPA: hypothetical protein VFQ65_03210, partial [Kofleriaceae bacterium]|nr:hypothetical protein [Kofleriaceae bacterium]